MAFEMRGEGVGRAPVAASTVAVLEFPSCGLVGSKLWIGGSSEGATGRACGRGVIGCTFANRGGESWAGS